MRAAFASGPQGWAPRQASGTVAMAGLEGIAHPIARTTGRKQAMAPKGRLTTNHEEGGFRQNDLPGVMGVLAMHPTALSSRSLYVIVSAILSLTMKKGSLGEDHKAGITATVRDEGILGAVGIVGALAASPGNSSSRWRYGAW